MDISCLRVSALVCYFLLPRQLYSPKFTVNTGTAADTNSQPRIRYYVVELGGKLIQSDFAKLYNHQEWVSKLKWPPGGSEEDSQETQTARETIIRCVGMEEFITDPKHL